MAAQYSVWAVPPPGSAVRARLQALVAELSARHAAPPFEPHVTVLGGAGRGLSEEEAAARTAALCTSLQPYTCRILEVASGASYFQCVFLRVIPSEEVMAANQSAAAAFGVPPANTSGYMPHLSLLYGDLSEVEKERVKETVKSDHSDVVVDMEFVVSSFALYLTDGEDKLMTTWKRIAEYPLTGTEA